MNSKHHFLRDVLSSTEEPIWLKQVEHLRALSNSSCPDQRLLALGRLGDELRRNPDALQESIEVLERALTLARQRLNQSHSGDALIAANWIRLATALQYSGHHAESLKMFQTALRWIQGQDLKAYEDFALQHMGKCLTEIGSFSEAKECFVAALKLRRAKGDENLMDSTIKTLDELSKWANL